ncbi:SDR family NAD(P)-dependent oxidoreductase [Collinsella aerofaciens]|uniref:SDR family NAD(P)-dependent oxidoreductase n=1 Tax=Collinsella aerofaciens TaxID=74426 RepID=UPI001EDF477F|nr:SDR family oxidoreductase [Collinsella aerofaciens]
MFGVKTALKNVLKKLRAKDVLPIQKVTDPDKTLEGKVAFVAGGSGGIGMAVAEALLDSGARVVLGGTKAEKLRACMDKLGHSDRIAFVVMDASNAEASDQVVSEATRAFGNIDIFVESTGVHTEGVNFWTMTPEEYDRVMSINLRGAFFLARSVAQHMIDSNAKGHILFVNSSRGFEPAWSPYGLSKWGLKGFTQGLAQTLLPYGIVVNGIAPGSTATPLIGVKEGDAISSNENGAGRLATPTEIAEWAKMLVGPSGDLVIGETVLVSGGRGGIDVR